MPKQIKQTVYIFCEGETEKGYFIKLSKILNIKVQIKTINLKGGTQLLDHPKRVKRKITAQLKHDKIPLLNQKVFIVFDLDIFNKEKLQNIKNILSDYSLIYNNECFEYWLLSHFEKYDLGGGKNKYLGKIKENVPKLMKDKFTGRTDFNWLTKVKIEMAIGNTKIVNGKSSGNLKGRDPYSNVYEIVNYLNN